MERVFEDINFKGTVIPRREYAANPGFYAEIPHIILEIDDQIERMLMGYFKSAGKGWRVQRVTLKPMGDSWSEQAKNFMFLVRDRAALLQGDTSRENKDNLYKSAKIECGLTGNDGKVRSQKTFNRREMWELTNKLLEWVLEAGGTIEDFDVEKQRLYSGQSLSEESQEASPLPSPEPPEQMEIW